MQLYGFHIMQCLFNVQRPFFWLWFCYFTCTVYCYNDPTVAMRDVNRSRVAFLLFVVWRMALSPAVNLSVDIFAYNLFLVSWLICFSSARNPQPGHHLTLQNRGSKFSTKLTWKPNYFFPIFRVDHWVSSFHKYVPTNFGHGSLACNAFSSVKLSFLDMNQFLV